VLLDIANYEGDWHYVVGSNAQNSTKIYVNPLQNSTNTDESGAIKPQLSLEITSPRFATFSNNTRFISVQNDTTFGVYDAELKTTYTFTSPVLLPKEGAKWMDGHRLHVTNGNSEHVFEYDGNNYQVLVESKDGYQSFYDRDYVRLFTLAPQTSGVLNFQVSNLTLTN
jgi:predicted nucleic-acid-binding Zn-ribbon protein